MSKEVKVTYLLVDKISSNLEKMNKALDSFEKRLAAMDKVTSDMSKSDSTNLGKWAKGSGENIKQLGKELTEFNKQVNGQKRQTLESYNTRIGTMGFKAQTATGRLNGMNQKLESTNEVLNSLVPKMGDMAAANEMMGESSRKSAGHLREQASAMRDLKNSVPAMVQAMKSIGAAERDVAGAMDRKNRAARQQSDMLSDINRKARLAERGLEQNRRGLNRFSKTANELQNVSFFGDGFDAGAMLSTNFAKLASLIPLVSLAIGGFGSAMNGLTPVVVGAAGSLTSLAGTLALLPGLYAAAGSAAAGAMSIMSMIVTPATEGLETMKGLTEQLTSAQAGVTSANQNVAQAMERVNAATTEAGSNSANAALEDAYLAQEKALTGVSKVQKEIAKLQKTIPPRAQELVDKITAVKDQWRATWFGEDGERAGRIIGSLIVGMVGVQNIMKLLEPSVERFADTLARAAIWFRDMSVNKSFTDDLVANMDAAQDNFDEILDTAQTLLPVVAKLAYEAQKFTGRILGGVAAWSRQVDQAEAVRKFHEYLNRTYDSLMVWFRAVKNFGSGLLTLFSETNGTVGEFEERLTSMSVRFSEWTKRITENGDAARYFENSWKIADAIGGVLLGLASVFGTLGSNATVAESTVEFLGLLESGLRSLGPYLEKVLTTLGPSMNAFLESLGQFTGAMSTPLLKIVTAITEGFTMMIDLANSLPGPVKAMLAAIIPLRLAMFSLGLVAGNLAAPFIIMQKLWKNTGVIATETALVWKKVAAYIALRRSQKGMAGLGTNAWGSKKGFVAAPMKASQAAAGAMPASMLAARGAGGAAMAGSGAAGLGATMSGGGAAAGGMAAALTGLAPVIAAVAAVVVLAAAAFLAFKDNVGGVADRMKGTLSTVFDSVKGKLDKLFEALGMGNDSFKAIASIADKTASIFMKVFKAIGVVVLEVGRFAATLTGAWIGLIIDNLTSVVNIVKDLYSSFMDIFRSENKWRALGEFILKAITAPFRILGSVVKNAMGALRDVVVGTFYGILDNMPDVIKDLLPGNIDGAIKKYKDAEAAAKKAREEGEAQKAWENGGAARSASATGDRYTAMAASYGIKAPAKKAGPKAKNTSVSSTYNTGSMPGYTGTTQQGAQVKWDLSTVASFNEQTNGIDTNLMQMMARIKGIGRVTKIGMDGMLAQINKAKDPIVAAMDSLGAAMVKPLHDYLVQIVGEVNSILTSTGGQPINPFGGFGASAASGGQTRPAAGDAPASSPGSILRNVAQGAPNWNGHPAANPALAPFVSAANALGVMVSSTTDFQHAKNSQHYSGDAVDLSNGSQPTPEMDRLYASLVPYAKSGAIGQLIYRDNFWDHGVKIPGIGGHDNHVHVGLGTGAGGEVELANMMQSLTGVPNFTGFGAGAMKGLGTKAFDALSAFGSSGGMLAEMDAGDGSVKGIAKAMMASFGWGAEEFSALDKLWTRESGWRVNADNPTSDAYGIPQALPGSKMASAGADWMTNPATQIRWGLGYIKDRYKSPSAAWAHSEAVNWYGRGGSFVTNGPQMIGVGDKQREHVSVTPLTGPNAPKNRSGGGIVVSPTIVLQGDFSGGRGAVRAAAQEAAELVSKEVIEALKAHAGDDI